MEAFRTWLLEHAANDVPLAMLVVMMMGSVWMLFCASRGPEGLIGKMLRYLETKGPWRAALLVPFAAIPFDYTENALSLFLLGQYQDGQVFPTLARMAGIVTAAKFLGLGCMGVTLLAVLLRTGTKFIAQKAGSSRGS